MDRHSLIMRKGPMRFNKNIKIGDFGISEDSPTFTVAEAGVNHNGDIAIAKRLIDCASEAGVDAVKFQAFKTEHLILKGVGKAPYQSAAREAEESQFDMLKKLELTKEESVELRRYCKKKDIIFLTTPFDEPSLEEISELDLPAYKIASTDLTNLPFLKRVAGKGKPVILSTGMSYMSEIESALKEIYPLNRDVILLQCTANYPIKDEEAALNVIKAYKDKFDILVGYSDHSSGIGASPYAVSMGAKVVEKHFTLDKNLDGPDHRASLDPEELKALVIEIRRVERYMGSGVKEPTESEQATRKALQKSLVATKTIKKGETFTEENLIAKRTGGIGISPVSYKDIIGRVADRDYERDEVINA